MRTIVLSFGHIEAKRLFCNPEGRKKDIIKTCCIDKALITWNAEKVNQIARERCGGATYLEINQIGPAVFNAHSGITAEGDNKVLMQKVVKDILQHMRKDKHDVPKLTKDEVEQLAAADDVSNFNSLKKLIFYREGHEIRHITNMLTKAVLKEG